MARDPRYNNRLIGHKIRSENARVVRADAQQHGRSFARQGDRQHLTGCMLYWAEGAKNRNSASLTNSDPALLRVFREFLRDCYDVDDDRFTLTGNFHLGNGLSVDEIYAYWLHTLDIPETALRKPAVVPPSPDPLKRKRLPYGTVTLTVCSTFIVQSIFGAIQEYGGFERPQWLD